MLTGKTISQLNQIDNVYDGLDLPIEYDGYTYKLSYDQLRKGIADYITAVTPSASATILPTPTPTPTSCNGGCRQYVIINGGPQIIYFQYVDCDNVYQSLVVTGVGTTTICSKYYPDYSIPYDQTGEYVFDIITSGCCYPTNPTPTPTPTVTKTPTSTPCVSSCRQYIISNLGPSLVTVSYVDCNGLQQVSVLSPGKNLVICAQSYPRYNYIPDPSLDYDQVSVIIGPCCNAPTPTPTTTPTPTVTPTDDCVTGCRYWFYNNLNAFPVNITYTACGPELIVETLSASTTGYTQFCVDGVVTHGLLPSGSTLILQPTGPCCSIPTPTPTPTPTSTPYILTGCTGNCYNFIIQNNTCFYIDVNFSGCGTSTTNITTISPFNIRTICSSLGPVVVYQSGFTAFQNPYTITQSGCCDCDCVYFDVYISQTDIDNATGNTLNPSFDGVVGLNYVPCGVSNQPQIAPIYFSASGLYSNEICISTTDTTVHNGNPNNGVSYLNTDYIWLWYRNNNSSFLSNTGPFYNPSNSSLVQSYVVNTGQCCFAPTPTPTPTPNVTPTITKTPALTPTITKTQNLPPNPTPTKTPTPSGGPCLSECDLIVGGPSYQYYKYNLGSNTFTYLSNQINNIPINTIWADELTHTTTKLWTRENFSGLVIYEYDINLCSFSGTTGRTISLPIPIPQGCNNCSITWETGLVALNNTTLYGMTVVSSSSVYFSQILSIDITNINATATLLYTMPNGYVSSWDMIIVDQNSANPKLIVGSGSLSGLDTYIIQYDLNTGSIDWITPPLTGYPTAMFTNNGNLYYFSLGFNNVMELYRVSTQSPYNDTFVQNINNNPLSQGIWVASQSPGCAWLYNNPSPTPTPTKTPTSTIVFTGSTSTPTPQLTPTPTK